MWSNFKAMPLLLKFITGHAFVCVVMFLVSVIPGSTLQIEGRIVSYAEWWSSGAGLFASMLGIFMPIAGVLLLKKLRYARPVYLLAVLFAFVGPYPIMGKSEGIVIGLVFVGLLALYLYARKPVQWYFSSNYAFKPTSMPSA